MKPVDAPEKPDTETIEHMTRAELRALIADIVREQQDASAPHGFAPGRPLGEVLDEIRAIRWTLPPGAKSSLELLREDRDR
jgi:hypothetical protein